MEKQKTKIAIVCGHFMPEIGYQEVAIAKTLVRLGCQVRVFTSTKVSPSKKKIINKRYTAGCEEFYDGRYSIIRLKSVLSLGAIIYPVGLEPAFRSFDPDIVFVIGVGKFFPLAIFYGSLRNSRKIVTFFGDNKDFYDWRGLSNAFKSTRVYIIKYLFKKWIYRIAINRSDLLVLYTPDTESILNGYCSRVSKNNLAKKKYVSSLGFDQQEYFYSLDERKKWRDYYHAEADEIFFITSTRIDSRKRIEKILSALDNLRGDGFKIRYILIGFCNDTYAQILKMFIAKLRFPDMVISLPVMNTEMIRQHYNAADIGIWMKAAISVQQAMGTGLQVALPSKQNVNHLVKTDLNGWFFSESELYEILKEILTNTNWREKREKRVHISDLNKSLFSYDKILADILGKI